MDNFSGISPLASPAGVAHTPDAAPVGSGHAGGFFGSSLVAVKYPGSFGAGAAAAGAAAGASALGASTAGAGAFASSAAKEKLTAKLVPSSIARNANTHLVVPRFIIPPLFSAVKLPKSRRPLFPRCGYESLRRPT